MEIINTNCATLSNYEVLKHLQKMRKKGKQKGQLATITYETIRYLEGTPCAKEEPDNIRKCLEALAPYNLNKGELLMIINTPPTTAVEIQLIIEESEERLTEQQVQEILQIIQINFPFLIKQETVNSNEEESS